MQKINDELLPVVLTIKESHNLIGQEYLVYNL